MIGEILRVQELSAMGSSASTDMGPRKLLDPSGAVINGRKLLESQSVGRIALPTERTA